MSGRTASTAVGRRLPFPASSAGGQFQTERSEKRYPALRRGPEWAHGNMAWLLAGRAARSLAQAILNVTVPIYVAAAGHGAVQVGYLLTTGSASAVLLALLAGAYGDRIGRQRVLLAFALLSALGAAACALTTAWAVLLVASAMACVGKGGGAGAGGLRGPHSAEQALIAASIHPNDRNAAFGAIAFMGAIGAALGSAMASLAEAMLNSAGIPVRQSFVMDISEEKGRSAVAAFSNLPSQLPGSVSPVLGSYLLEAVGPHAPLLMAAAVRLLNSGAYFTVFRHVRPPEEAE